MANDVKPSGQWKNRIVSQGVKPAKDYLANPLNWRIHGRAQQEALVGVLSEVGWVQSVVENVRTGHLIDGHLRVLEAMRISEDEPVPFVQVDLDEPEEALVLATLDPLSAMAGTDKKQLEGLLSEVKTTNEAVRGLLESVTPGQDKAEIAAELEITPELFERHDYLVILFDNDFDWNVACERLGVKKVSCLSPETQTLSGPMMGTGRVIRSQDFLRAIGA